MGASGPQPQLSPEDSEEGLWPDSEPLPLAKPGMINWLNNIPSHPLLTNEIVGFSNVIIPNGDLQSLFGQVPMLNLVTELLLARRGVLGPRSHGQEGSAVGEGHGGGSRRATGPSVPEAVLRSACRPPCCASLHGKGSLSSLTSPRLALLTRPFFVEPYLLPAFGTFQIWYPLQLWKQLLSLFFFFVPGTELRGT